MPATPATRDRPGTRWFANSALADAARAAGRISVLAAYVVMALGALPAQGQSLEDQLDAIAREVKGEGNQSASGPEDGLADATSSQPLLDTLQAVADDFAIPDASRFDSSLPKRLGTGRISERLLRLADQSAKSGAALDEQAKALGVPYDDGLLGVRLYATSEREVAAIRRRVERSGGTVEATFGNVVMARVAPRRIEAVGNLDSVHYADAASMFHPLQRAPGYGERVSEAVGIVGVDRLHREGMTGRGVKVGILDFGFTRYSELERQGEVPAYAGAAAFNRARRVEANSEHGTGCAEIVADMAPDAELYLAAVDGAEGQIVAAGRWLVEQGVDIINFSGGGHYGPHNGTAVLDRFVDWVVEQGILWVNAAGNEGASHWTGLAQDRNRNSFVDIKMGYPDIIAVQGRNFGITVVWDDWGRDPSRPSSSQDIDAYLLARRPDGAVVPIAASREVQNGRGVPAEMVGLRGAPGNQVFFLALHGKRVTRPVRVHVLARGARMAPIEPGHSIGIPATARNALAVAAVNVRGGRIQPYSSRGPTDDGRQKPEVSGHDNTTSLAYGRGGRPGRFHGTSAAAPHVAGFAALLQQANPGASPSALRQAVLRNVTPLGGGSPNHVYGHGLIHGGKLRGTPVREDEGTDDDPEGILDDDEFERALRDLLDR